MKRLSAFLLFAVLVSLIAAIPAPAADLQAGWYAWPFSPQIFIDDGLGNPTLRSSGDFITAPGTYGVFTVTGGPFGSTSWRKATVTLSVNGVGPSDSLVLPLVFTMNLGEPFLYMDISWGTEYDASQMRLELWRSRYDGSTERVWTQGLSGPQSGGPRLLYDGVYEGAFYYQVTVIPEPSAAMALLALLSMGGVAHLLRRRG